MYLKRKIESYLVNWTEGKNGLLIVGQRQTGKTFIVKNTLKQKFGKFIKIDLALDKDKNIALSTCKNIEEFYERLHLMFMFDDKDQSTLLFIDEIQESYKYQNEFKNNEWIDLITLSKAIVSKNGMRIVFSGSLLGIEIFNVLERINSLPMGYLDVVEMFPLDFEEFLWANGIDETNINKLKNSLKINLPIDEYVHKRMMALFNEYLLVGGMPQAVVSFVEEKNLQIVELIHKQINGYILNDISKYANINNKLKIKEIYNILPSELNSNSKRFNLNEIANFKKEYDYSLSFTWLTNAAVAIPVFNSKDLKIPLAINSNRNLLKLFHADVGLLTYSYFDYNLKQNILMGKLNVNKGAIVENFVAQSLRAHGFTNLYYYNNKKNGELDFVIQYHGKILPIEVKSGKDYKRHSALTNCINNKEYDIEKAIVFCNSNIVVEGKIIYLPIYLASFLENK